MTTENTKLFNLFKEECLYWINEFSLNDWEVSFDRTDDYECVAKICWNTLAKNATIVLSSRLDKESSHEFYIRGAAFHEVCELLLSYLVDELIPIYASEYIQEKVHSIIRRLENTFFNKKYDKLRKDYINKLGSYK